MQIKKIFEALIEDASYNDLMEMHKKTLKKLIEMDSEIEQYHSNKQNNYSGLAILGNDSEVLSKNVKSKIVSGVEVFKPEFPEDRCTKNMATF